MRRTIIKSTRQLTSPKKMRKIITFDNFSKKEEEEVFDKLVDEIKETSEAVIEEVQVQQNKSKKIKKQQKESALDTNISANTENAVSEETNK